MSREKGRPAFFPFSAQPIDLLLDPSIFFLQYPDPLIDGLDGGDAVLQGSLGFLTVGQRGAPRVQQGLLAAPSVAGLDEVVLDALPFDRENDDGPKGDDDETYGAILVAATGIGLWSCPTDGSAWTSAGMSATHVLWDGGRFVAPVITPTLFGGIDRSPIIPTSTDGVHWSSVVQPVTHNYQTEFWPALAFLGTNYFDGERKTSDLVDWDFLQTVSVYPKWVFGTGSKLIGVADNGPVLECNDQQKWTQLYAGQEYFTETLWTGTRLIGTIVGRGDFAHSVPGTPWSYTGLPGAKSLAWTGSRALIATGTGLFSVENLPAVPHTWDAYLNQAFPGITDPSIIGASANPDGDDSPNLVEYAMATDPSVLNVEPFVEILPGTATSGTKYTWTQASHAIGVVLVPQISADLLEWDDVTGTLVSSTADSVTMTYTPPGKILRFFRLSARMVP